MDQNETNVKTLDDYKAAQIRFHMDLMKICRRYINEIDIASIVGIIDIVKRETIDLEGATNQNIRYEESKENMEKSDTSYF